MWFVYSNYTLAFNFTILNSYGYVTNTKIKIVIIIDSTNSLLRDNEIRAVSIIIAISKLWLCEWEDSSLFSVLKLFRKLHNSYSELISDPFYTPGDPIIAK